MKKTVFFTLLFFTILYTHAQNTSLSSDLIWELPKTISHYYDINQKNINKTEFLTFEKACYYDQQSLLPYYFELIKVNSTNINVTIDNVNYKTLDIDELKVLKNKTQISTQLNYNYKITYGRKQAYLQFDLLPFRKNPSTGQIEKVISFVINIKEITKSISYTKPKSKSFLSESVLKSGKWVKIRLNKNGIFKLTYSEIIDMGFENP